MKYKVGDKVKVREDLIVGREYGGWVFVEEMAEFLGKEVIIEGVISGACHTVCGNGWHWTDEMFESKFNLKSLMQKNLIDVEPESSADLFRLYIETFGAE